MQSRFDIFIFVFLIIIIFNRFMLKHSIIFYCYISQRTLLALFMNFIFLLFDSIPHHSLLDSLNLLFFDIKILILTINCHFYNIIFFMSDFKFKLAIFYDFITALLLIL
jgi:hypothetical protein